MLARILKKRGIEVLLTRTDDCTLQLDQRTTKANNYGADLFISLHANNAANDKASGIETFVVALNSFKFSDKTMQGVALNDYHAQVKHRFALSSFAARLAQKKMIESVHTMYAGVKDRGVKEYMYQVCIGAQMPAILVEVGFLSHQVEAGFLNDTRYRTRIIEGIAQAVMGYFATKPTEIF